MEFYPGVTAWQEARGKVPGAGEAPGIEVYRKVPGYDWQRFPNCLDNAFQSAADTLDERIQTFGAGHAGIRSWVAAQNAVFSNCSEGNNIPVAPEEGLPPKSWQPIPRRIRRCNTTASACWWSRAGSRRPVTRLPPCGPGYENRFPSPP
ncbi:MAG: hypothetical protein H6Q05_4009 [Acidobacteria bacterium]|nr:hypothetical protein [Acidobacteriota bacterium]